MSQDTLVALIAGLPAGLLRQDGFGRLHVTYDEGWRARDDAVPLSLSMPLAAAEHPHRIVEPYLWGLLPDSPAILDRWARRFRCSARNPFALLIHVGEDCAGAVQFVRTNRLASVQAAAPPEIRWLSTAEIARRLRTLRKDRGAWRSPDDAGQFSLSGAQPKTALIHLKERFGIPRGRTPTSHILKPPLPGFEGHIENEHFCLRLARGLGLPAAASDVRRFGREFAIVVTRYDRAPTADLAAAAAATGAIARAEALRDLARIQPVIRLHQEDLCQAMAVRPSAKYQGDGGPSPADIVKLLRTHSDRPNEDVATFVDALALNWLIAGTDAHAKNYSLLHSTRGRVRLAPLYDLASVLPYPDFDSSRLAAAMRIGSEYRLARIGRHEWTRLAEQLRLSPRPTLDRVAELAARLPAAAREVADEMTAQGLRHPVVRDLRRKVSERAELCLGLLEGR